MATTKAAAKKTKSAPEVKPTTSDIVEKTAMGEIKIHENVIGDVVEKALEKMKGTVSLEGSSLASSIAGILGGRSKGGIGIDMHEEAVNIAVKVNIKYGESIPQIAAKVQSTIKEQVMNITGTKVEKVNVMVQSLFTEPPKEEEEEEEE